METLDLNEFENITFYKNDVVIFNELFVNNEAVKDTLSKVEAAMAYAGWVRTAVDSWSKGAETFHYIFDECLEA